MALFETPRPAATVALAHQRAIGWVARPQHGVRVIAAGPIVICLRARWCRIEREQCRKKKRGCKAGFGHSGELSKKNDKDATQRVARKARRHQAAHYLYG
jgi:hypothetical protein